jgi:hypothetical protein
MYRWRDIYDVTTHFIFIVEVPTLFRISYNNPTTHHHECSLDYTFYKTPRSTHQLSSPYH